MDLMEHLLEKDVSINDIIERDVAILNSLANYTYTHQLLKCKVEILSLKVLKLQFTCKIKEHKDFILLALSTAGSTVLSTVKATLSSLENFGAQRANHVYSTAFSSPRN